ncbi:MAG: hypothetical protein RMJ66_02150 [Bacteroidia bacterium]|nr:hypothetical protein [Bacteroidia bacterium]MDW8133849.1 hypothetical protein [Bacteroidia bacterium]
MRKWLLVCLSWLSAQRAGFIYALWDLDFEAAEREVTLEWNGSYITWDNHRIAFFKALFPLSPAERKAFWETTNLYERQFERQIAPTLPELVADAYAQRAVIAAMERDWLSAGMAAWKSWRLIQKGLPRDPLTHQWQGLWQVVFATLPPPYERWIPGKPEQRWAKAIEHLRQAAQSEGYIVWEASLLYFFLLKNFDTLAGKWLDSCRYLLFSQRVPPYLWRFAIALHAVEEGRLGEAETMLVSLSQLPQVSRFPYALYWLGKVYLYQGRWKEAEETWRQFVIKQFQPFGLASQYTWRGYIAWTRGDTTMAKELWHAAISYSNLLWEEDIIAQEFAKGWLVSPPHKVEQLLWKVRWLIQRRQFEAARDSLEPLREMISSLTGDDRAMLYYTYGRLYHRWGREEPARFAYYQATRQVTEKEHWIRGYAALYLAQLYERAGDWHNARLYYKEAEKIAQSVGRTGLIQKARAGYERVKDKRYEVAGDVSQNR